MCIVALSGFGEAEDRQRSLEAGCDEHLIKPVSDVELSRAINGPGGSTRPEGIAGALER
jgi:CheY-like chemotaxis protein